MIDMFFVFKQKTAYEVRISDWSSDVCSSDLLQPGWESFVGAGPMVMRHGLTMGEMGHWFIRHFNLDVDYRVIGMAGWDPKGPGFGWPTDRVWIHPSPNAANVNMARAYAGRSEEHTSELQSLIRTSYAVF